MRMLVACKGFEKFRQEQMRECVKKYGTQIPQINSDSTDSSCQDFRESAESAVIGGICVQTVLNFALTLTPRTRHLVLGIFLLTFCAVSAQGKEKDLKLNLPLKDVQAQCCTSTVEDALKSVEGIKEVRVTENSAAIKFANPAIKLSAVNKALEAAMDKMGKKMGKKYEVDFDKVRLANVRFVVDTRDNEKLKSATEVENALEAALASMKIFGVRTSEDGTIVTATISYDVKKGAYGGAALKLLKEKGVKFADIALVPDCLCRETMPKCGCEHCKANSEACECGEDK